MLEILRICFRALQKVFSIPSVTFRELPSASVFRPLGRGAKKHLYLKVTGNRVMPVVLRVYDAGETREFGWFQKGPIETVFDLSKEVELIELPENEADTKRISQRYHFGVFS